MAAVNPGDDLPRPIELLEEAVHLLRRMSASAWCGYFLGSVPFWLALLYLWACLSLGPMLPGNLALSAGAAALLYLGMKVAHCAFCRQLLAARLERPLAPLGWAGWRRLAAGQLRTQPWALALFWMSLPLLLPFPGALAYGQSISVFGEEPQPAKAAGNDSLRVGRTEILLTALLVLVLAVLYLNVYAACLLLPWLGTHLLGLDNPFELAGLSQFNATFAIIALAFAWLAFDPLLKSVFTLRVFYRRSLRTGEDLQVEARRLPRLSRAAVAAIAVLVALAPRVSAASAPAPVHSLSQADLDRAVDRALHHPEYAWHRARPGADQRSPSGLPGALDSAVDFVQRQSDRFFGALGEAWRWLTGRDSVNAPDRKGSAGAPARIMWTLAVLAIVGIVALGIGILAQTGGRRVSKPALAAPPGENAVDLAAEHIDASRLPTNGWLALARDLAQRGEWRLALRAAYLATLAALADRDLIRLAKAKTNLDYERELRRRAAAQGELVQRFAQRRREFEGVWYGRAAAEETVVLGWIGELERGSGP